MKTPKRMKVGEKREMFLTTQRDGQGMLRGQGLQVGICDWWVDRIVGAADYDHLGFVIRGTGGRGRYKITVERVK